MALDTLYTAETPEGIALSLRPAGLVPRVLAYLVDFGIRLGLYMVVGFASAPFGGMGSALLLVVYFLLEWFYPVAFELALHGATPGKRMLGLQVVMDSGLPVTPAASVIRNLLRAADFLPALYALGVASLLWRHDFKRLGDLAAGTLVVHSDTVALHGKIPAARTRAPARALAPQEQAAIVAWAGRATRLTPARLDELAVLAQSVTATAPPGGDGDATQRLLGVAHWLVGNRHSDTST
ncbi:MAG TPA: RDD family protein [Rhizobacter sp.]|nr:RDD family protein [Rhizobacter sp.]